MIDGIVSYVAEIAKDHEDYHASGLDRLYEAEKSHFWFLARRELIARVFDRFVARDEDVIEIGAGTGSVARKLQEVGYRPAVGELHLPGLYYAKSYGVQDCYQFDLFDPPFREAFDVVGMFDVLEHLEDDTAALRHIRTMLRAGGRIILTVPAHGWLWSRDDQIAGHKRRYTRSSLQRVAEAAGFRVEKADYFFIAILPLLWLRHRLRPAKRSVVVDREREQEIRINPWVNRLLLAISRLENRMRSFLPNRAGGSLLLVARKTT